MKQFVIVPFSLLAVIDDSGLFTLYAVKGDNGDCAALDRKQLATILRKDVWDIIFAEVSGTVFRCSPSKMFKIFYLCEMDLASMVQNLDLSKIKSHLCFQMFTGNLLQLQP